MKMICLLLIVNIFLFCPLSNAQPAIGTTTFTGNIGVITAAAASPRSGTIKGWTFTLFSAVNAAITNGSSAILLISSPVGTGIWQHGTIAASDGSAFSLTSLHFHVQTAGFVGKTFTFTGFKSGSPVAGATITSSSVSATLTIVNVNTSGITAFSNIDEINVTPSGSAQGTWGLDDITIATVTPLPVVWNGPITVIMNEGNPVVGWSVSSQVNNAEFIVDRSTNNNDFSSVGTVQPLSETNYQFIDHTAPAGPVEYRIKQVDRDGKFTYSNIAVINVPRLPLSIYPNPTFDKVLLSHVVPGDVLKLTNLSGRLLLARPATGDQSIDLSPFPAGVYFLTSQKGAAPTKIIKL